LSVLAIDAGNSRTKWGVHDGDWLAQGAVENAHIADLADVLQPWAGCERAAISNVAGVALAGQLQAILAKLGIAPVFVTAQAAACGVNNGYADPRQLGSDRWAALVAAWNLHHAPCVVATAGTALTVDALADGEFIGGLIVPGLAAMKQAIVASTAAVAITDGRLAEFPDNTGDAVHSGALRAMAGAVESVCDHLQARTGRMPLCLVGGGDASALLPALHRPAQMADNLVLQGLLLIAEEMA